MNSFRAIFVFFAISAVCVFGSVPIGFNYQGRILDDGAPVTGDTNVVIALYNAATGGTLEYAETQTVSVVNGFYSMEVGAGHETSLAAALDTSGLYLETTIGNSVMSPRERLISVPYAINARNAEHAEDCLKLTGGTISGSVTNNKFIYLPRSTNLVFADRNICFGNGGRSYSTSTGSVAIGVGATARYRTSGVALGSYADGDYNGISIGYHSDGQYSNISIGFQSSAYSGYDRIAIGRDITNRRNNTAAIRGTLYLDGGTGLLYRSTFGQGGWIPKAFTIPHPKDPENWVLRHFCLEGPDVWNVYAGNTRIKNGEATVELPDYYDDLNLAGSEVYDLTAIGAPASLYIKQEVEKGQFVIGGSQDVKVSWTIKVKRNDPGCLEGLDRLPVEQPVEELIDHERWRQMLDQQNWQGDL